MGSLAICPGSLQTEIKVSSGTSGTAIPSEVQGPLPQISGRLSAVSLKSLLSCQLSAKGVFHSWSPPTTICALVPSLPLQDEQRNFSLICSD